MSRAAGDVALHSRPASLVGARHIRAWPTGTARVILPEPTKAKDTSRAPDSV